MARRTSTRPDTTTDRQIPLAELTRLLASYAAQSSDTNYNGHQETTVDGGTITIYGIRRVNNTSRGADEDADGDGAEGEGLFPPPTTSDRRPRRIFNFIGPSLGEIDPLPPEFEETFERLRRSRRPRSMFGSGSLRRNGVVEPDTISSPPSATPATTSDDATGSGGDETWIFYIVSAVLPEGHPLLNAPSLFTDNPTYEDMLFLDSFLAKPVASREDLERAGGNFVVRKSRGGGLIGRRLEGSGRRESDSNKEQEEDEEKQEGLDVLLIAEGERCLVCLADYEVGEEARKLGGCGHFFHRECVDTVSSIPCLLLDLCCGGV